MTGSPPPSTATLPRPEDVLIRDPGCSWTRAGDQVVILRPAQGLITVLSAVAGEVWARLDGEASLADIAGALTSGYKVEAAVALDDTLGFAAELLGKGLAIRQSTESP